MKQALVKQIAEAVTLCSKKADVAPKGAHGGRHAKQTAKECAETGGIHGEGTGQSNKRMFARLPGTKGFDLHVGTVNSLAYLACRDASSRWWNSGAVRLPNLCCSVTAKSICRHARTCLEMDAADAQQPSNLPTSTCLTNWMRFFADLGQESSFFNDEAFQLYQQLQAGEAVPDDGKVSALHP